MLKNIDMGADEKQLFFLLALNEVLPWSLIFLF